MIPRWAYCETVYLDRGVDYNYTLVEKTSRFEDFFKAVKSAIPYDVIELEVPHAINAGHLLGILECVPNRVTVKFSNSYDKESYAVIYNVKNKELIIK